MAKKNNKAELTQKDIREKTRSLSEAVRDGIPARISKELNSVREPAIYGRDDIYLSVLMNAKKSRGAESEAYVLMNSLYNKVCAFLEKLEEDKEEDPGERQELVDAISEANSSLVETLLSSPKAADQQSRFYLQHYIIDLTFARAAQVDHIFDLLGMYYYLLRMWNDEQSGSEDFRQLLGEEAETDFIRRAYSDIKTCENYKKFGGIKWITYLTETAQKDERPHVSEFSNAVRLYMESLKQNSPWNEPKPGKGAAAGQGSTQSSGTAEGQTGKTGKAGTAPAGDDPGKGTDPDGNDLGKGKDPESGKSLKGQGEKGKTSENEREPERGSGVRPLILALIVIFSMLFGGIVGFVIGSSRSHISDSVDYAETSETADQGNTENSAAEITGDEGEQNSVEYEQKEEKPDSAETESSKQDPEAETNDQEEGKEEESGSSGQSGQDAEAGNSDQGEGNNEESGSSEQGSQENKKSGSEDQGKQSESEDNQNADAVDNGKEGVEYKLEEKQELRLERRKVIFKHDIF